MTLPELSRAGLLDLKRKADIATLAYETALNATVAAIGLDPRDKINVNLDTGEVTQTEPAPPKE